MNVSLRTVGVWLLGGCVGFMLPAPEQQADAQTSSPPASQEETVLVGSATRQVDRSPAPRIESYQSPRQQYYEARRRGNRPATFGFGGFPSFSMGFSPRHQRAADSRLINESAVEEIPGEIVFESGSGEIITSGEMMPNTRFTEGGCTSCGNRFGGCRSCRQQQTGCMLSCPGLNLDNLEVFGGVQGFKSPANRGLDGSFGFYEGLNYTAPLPCRPCSDIWLQAGFQVAHSNLSGASFTTDRRDQYFFTAGVYRRVDCGLQWGAVFDYLHDEWDVAFDVSQIRGEISWVYPYRDEIGIWFTSSLRDVDVTLPNTGAITLETSDVYAFFYRHQFAECYGGGQGRVFAGFTGQSDGIVGSDVLFPISDRLAFTGEFTYLIPDENTVAGGRLGSGNFGESWNVSIGLVWYPGRCRSDCDGNRYNRALLNVANNGSMLINDR